MHYFLHGGFTGLNHPMRTQLENQDLVDFPYILKLFVKGLLVWIALSILFLFIGPNIIRILLPYFTFILNFISDNYISVLALKEFDGNMAVQASATTIRPIRFTQDLVLNTGYKVEPITNVIHNLVPLVIYFTVVLSWPAINIKERLILCLLGIPASLFMLGLFIPTILAGHIESQILIEAEEHARQVFNTPFIMKYVVFMESGGRWLIPLIMALLCRIITMGYFKNTKSITN